MTEGPSAKCVKRQGPSGLRHAGKRFHHPEGIAEGARGMNQLFLLELGRGLFRVVGGHDGLVALALGAWL
jgi:hypothetical protein